MRESQKRKEKSSLKVNIQQEHGKTAVNRRMFAKVVVAVLSMITKKTRSVVLDVTVWYHYRCAGLTQLPDPDDYWTCPNCQD